jgi:hypothetical protein
VILVGSELQYFKNKLDAKPQGSILLANCSLASQGPGSSPAYFELTSQGSTFVFEFESADEATFLIWIDSIESKLGSRSAATLKREFVDIFLEEQAISKVVVPVHQTAANALRN